MLWNKLNLYRMWMKRLQLRIYLSEQAIYYVIFFSTYSYIFVTYKYIWIHSLITMRNWMKIWNAVYCSYLKYMYMNFMILSRLIKIQSVKISRAVQLCRSYVTHSIFVHFVNLWQVYIVLLCDLLLMSYVAAKGYMKWLAYPVAS